MLTFSVPVRIAIDAPDAARNSCKRRFTRMWLRRSVFILVYSGLSSTNWVATTQICYAIRNLLTAKIVLGGESIFSANEGFLSARAQIRDSPCAIRIDLSAIFLNFETTVLVVSYLGHTSYIPV
jgi:hypothetical protein